MCLFNNFRPDIGREGESSCVVMKEEEDTGLEEHIKKMVTIRRKALENIQVAQKRQKTQYDAKHSQDKAMYKVGTLVLVKNSRKLSRKGSKMAPNWFGPYCIHEVLKKGTFRLSQVEDDKKVLTQIYNMTRLKLYYQRQAADENSLPCDPPLQSTSDSTQMPLTQATTDCTQMPLTPATSDSTQMPSKQATSDSTQMPLTQATSDSTQMPSTQATSDSTQMPLTQATTDCTQIPLTRAILESTQMPLMQVTSKQLEEELFSSSLMRFWRTGADCLAFSSKEDEDLDVSITIYSLIKYRKTGHFYANRLRC